MLKQTQYRVLRFTYVVLLVAMSLFFVFPFIVPILLASTIALTLYPLQIKLEHKNWKKNRAAILLTTLFTVVISIPFIFFVAKGTSLVIDLLEKGGKGKEFQNQGIEKIFLVFKNDIVGKILKYQSEIPFGDFFTESNINSYLKSISTYLVDFLKNFAFNIPSVILFLLIMILCTFSFLNGAGRIRLFFQSLFGFNNRKMDQIIGIFLRDSRQVYFSNIVTGAFQSLLVATGVYLVLGADWFLVFFVTLIFSFVPVIGAAPMAFLFALAAFFQGSHSGALILILLGSFTGVVDNIMRPWLASFGESRAPGVVSFIFVIGGAVLLGLPGLFIGLLVGAITYDTLPIFWESAEKPEATRNLSGLFSFGDKSKGGEETSKQ